MATETRAASLGDTPSGRHHRAQSREKRLRPSVTLEARQDAKHVFLAHGESGADRVGIDANALELVQQMCKPLRLRHLTQG